jgi:hypothetical protein
VKWPTILAAEYFCGHGHTYALLFFVVDYFELGSSQSYLQIVQ